VTQQATTSSRSAQPAKGSASARSLARRQGDRSKYFTLQQAADAYPVFTIRLLRRLVQERRIAFSRVGRSIVLSASDIEAYVEGNRVEPPMRTPRWDLAS